MRQSTRGRRAALSPAERSRASEAIAAQVIAHPTYVGAGVVALYCDFRDEVETATLRQHVLSAGKQLALPRVEDGGTLTLRVADGHGAPLVQSPLGIWEPAAEAGTVSPAHVDLFILPGLGFDRSGGRLGYGRGHYDRLLTAARPESTWMGLAFACQWVAAVPLEPHDVRLQYVVTEDGVHATGA